MNYTIIAGVNGAGKSIFYHSKQFNEDVLGVRINVDELIHEKYNNNWKDVKTQVKAGREIIGKINKCMESRLSFNQETTLAGKSIIKTIEKAKELEYTINLYYIGIDSSELAIERVNRRVQLGGHGIPGETIIKRYSRSLENLQVVLPLCDNVYIYDNSIVKKNILIIKEKEIIFKLDFPEYIKKYLDDYIRNLSDKTKDTLLEDDWNVEL